MIQDTSISAYFDIRPELGTRQALVYGIIKYLKECSNLEISRFGKIPINAVTPRTNELRKKGLVVKVGKRKCSVSGKIVLVWSIANAK
jgi:DNA-binding MarR family transcriptional regulator